MKIFGKENGGGGADIKKAKLLTACSAALVGLVLAYNLIEDYVSPILEGYVQRRIYYETVISKKRLSEHRAMFWKEQK